MHRFEWMVATVSAALSTTQEPEFFWFKTRPIQYEELLRTYHLGKTPSIYC